MKQMIVMRTDLQMRRGKEISQACHASLAATLANMEHPAVIEWLAGSFTKIALKIDSEEALLKLVEDAKLAGVITSLIQDEGRTVFHGVHTYTCAAIGPASDEDLEKLTGHLKLR
jgi:PTH2 family peptidyl-tRNA hydrolase